MPYFEQLNLVMIDEVHLLSESRRGATLEAVVSRLGYIKFKVGGLPLRFAAVSATVPNLNDLGAWLNAPFPRGVLTFGEEFRPCPLQTVVKGFGKGFKNENEFLFDRSLNDSVAGVIAKYSEKKPCLVFCTSRKNAKELAMKLCNESQLQNPLTASQQQQRRRLALQIHDNKPLESCLLRSMGWHTAEHSPVNLQIIEEMFRQGLLSVLTCTTTLAMGVNLPARLVVVKNTQAYRGSGRGMEDIPKTTILQMVGRAGRAGFDTHGTAVIMTKKGNEMQYMSLLEGAEPVTSALQENIQELLVNEIVLGSIESVMDASNWLRSTFLFQLAKTEPERRELNLMLFKHMEEIRNSGCVTNIGDKFQATALGEIVCRHYLRLQTVIGFERYKSLQATEFLLNDTEAIRLILNILANATEFQDMVLRRDQKKWLNEVAWSTGRFHSKKKDRVTTVPDKLVQLFQALLGRLTPSDSHLRMEMGSILPESIRIGKALLKYFTDYANHALAIQVQVFLRCLQTKSWEEEGELLQLEKIGIVLSQKLNGLGIATLQELIQFSCRKYEVLVTELGKNRIKSVLRDAKMILANRVHLVVSPSVGFPQNTLTVHLKLTSEVNRQASVTGFQVFVIHNLALLNSMYMRPGEKLDLSVDKKYRLHDVKVFAIHPRLHGLDVQYPAPTTVHSKPRKLVVPKVSSRSVAKKSKMKKKQSSSSHSISKYFGTKQLPCPVTNVRNMSPAVKKLKTPPILAAKEPPTSSKTHNCATAPEVVTEKQNVATSFVDAFF